MGSLRYEGNRLHSNEEEVAYTSDEGGTTTGDTANGSWTKFGDGTMICWGYILGDSPGVDGTTEYLIPIVFPIAFIDVDVTITFTPVLLYDPGQSQDNGAQVTVAVRDITSQGCTIVLRTPGLWLASDSQDLHWVAMGRWRTIV